MVKIVENPLASTEPKALKKSEISSHKQSLASIMPKGLLDKLTREEILDLISYIAAAGDPNHPLFQGDHAAGHGHGGAGGALRWYRRRLDRTMDNSPIHKENHHVAPAHD